MRSKVSALSALYFLLGVCVGIVLLEGYQRVRWSQAEAKSVHDDVIDSRIEIPVKAVRSNRMMVALTFGQAGSSNAGETPKKANGKVFNFYNGKIYLAEDPLLGASGDGGSVWTRLGDQLIERALYDTVIFAPIGVGGSAIANWQPGSDLHDKLLQTIRKIQQSGLTITHLLWHQGESDALRHTDKEEYQTMFRTMLANIRNEGVTAPIYVAISSSARCKKIKSDSAIRQAQEQLVDNSNGIFSGPDTDILGLADRFDGCHFSDQGLEKMSTLWFEALTDMKRPPQF